MNKIAVLTHNPKGKWGDVRPQIEQGSYEKWGKGGISLELGQQVLIYISKGVNQIKYIMEVSSVYEDSVDLKLIKKFNESESKLLSFEKLKQNGLKTGTVNYILDNNESLFKYVISILNNKVKKKNIIQTKNIMLYGAPGVGKTHNYKRLISMIENSDDEKTIFDTISKNETTEEFNNIIFETIKKDKRIEFVTFHQSYSYEDFIEGFRPNKDGNIELEDGVFKIISDKAKNNLENSQKSLKTLEEEFNLLKKFKNYVNYKIENSEKLTLQRGEEFFLNKFENDILYFNASSKSNINDGFNLKYRDFISIYYSLVTKRTLQDISTILGTNSIQQKYAYYLQIYHDFKNYHLNKKEDREKINNEQKNFYIVIDEINRGNISKIFGELITLIEEDKRDSYEVTLPYSKERFKIPSNLYIIATMNSTDKSIATIDIALRRRFTFLKMKPNIDLVSNIAKELFTKLNEHITKTINEDYQLGHSYFMNINNEEDLEFIKKYKIQPLLEEYFYGDVDNYNEALKILDIKEKEFKGLISNE